MHDSIDRSLPIERLAQVAAQILADRPGRLRRPSQPHHEMPAPHQERGEIAADEPVAARHQDLMSVDEDTSPEVQSGPMDTTWKEVLWPQLGAARAKAHDRSSPGAAGLLHPRPGRRRQEPRRRPARPALRLSRLPRRRGPPGGHAGGRRKERLWTEEQVDGFHAIIRRRTQELLQAHPKVAVTQATYFQKYRDLMREAVPDIEFLWVVADHEVNIRRIRERKDYVSVEYFESTLHYFEKPPESTKKIVNNSDDFEIIRQLMAYYG